MELSDIPNGKKIILFDGVCNLCDSFVQFVIKRDRNDLFRFVPLQSGLGEKILDHIGIDRKHIDSMIMYDPGVAYYYKSEAAIEIARSLGGVFTLTAAFKILPKVLRNGIYDYVARNRYKWYGKKDNCMIPTPALKAKFLE